MKKPIILGFAVAVLALTSVTASADSQYPASDFQPQVIYLDKSVVPTQSPTPTTAPVACPVNATTTTAAAQPVVDEFDPKYPAASFQPKVIYP
jgi:hypothetical protein